MSAPWPFVVLLGEMSPRAHFYINNLYFLLLMGKTYLSACLINAMFLNLIYYYWGRASCVVRVHIWKSEDNFVKSVFFFHLYMG